MKFLADMGISPKAVAHLQAHDHDAVHLIEEGLHRLSDRSILAKARTEGRIVLTHDLDFGDLMAASGAHLPSVIIFRLANMAAINVNNHLDIILRERAQVLQQGAILSITERRIRIRSLPIDTVS
jgi:predicted nuclease of predicted toxin-antitoxin system